MQPCRGEDVDLDQLNQIFVEAISRRRCVFDSRTAALAYFHKHPMFSLIHPHVIHALVECGLEDAQGTPKSHGTEQCG